MKSIAICATKSTLNLKKDEINNVVLTSHRYITQRKKSDMFFPQNNILTMKYPVLENNLIEPTLWKYITD